MSQSVPPGVGKSPAGEGGAKSGCHNGANVAPQGERGQHGRQPKRKPRLRGEGGAEVGSSVRWLIG
jgi:hypothetical protein